MSDPLVTVTIDPLVTVRWQRIGEWAGDFPDEVNECREITMRDFVARLARTTKRGNIVQILSVKVVGHRKIGQRRS